MIGRVSMPCRLIVAGAAAALIAVAAVTGCGTPNAQPQPTPWHYVQPTPVPWTADRYVQLNTDTATSLNQKVVYGTLESILGEATELVRYDPAAVAGYYNPDTKSLDRGGVTDERAALNVLNLYKVAIPVIEQMTRVTAYFGGITFDSSGKVIALFNNTFRRPCTHSTYRGRIGAWQQWAGGTGSALLVLPLEWWRS